MLLGCIASSGRGLCSDWYSQAAAEREMFGTKRNGERYKDAIVLVVGGASGMGKLSAKSLAERGATVVVADNDVKGLAAIGEQYPDWHTRTLDVSSAAACEQLVGELEEEVGPLYRVTVTAAIAPGSEFLEDSAEGFARVMRINVEGVSNMAHAVIPRMLKRQGGEFVAYGSVAGEMLTPGLSAYCTSKAAVNAYMEVLSWELRDTDVFVHCARPPGVKTSMLEQMTAGQGDNMIAMGLEQDIFVEPETIVAAIEGSIDKKQSVSFPHVSAKVIHLMRRLSPRFTWWLIGRSEK